MAFWIMTTNETRREQWDRILGMTSLPVTTHKPIMIRRGRFRAPVYMIDAAALAPVQRMRLIGYLWRTRYMTTVAAIAAVEAGVLIDGRDCEVLEPVDESPPAFSYRYAHAT